MDNRAPLILTARFDAASADLFNAMRRRHFPERLNIVPAHCTLFHHLAGEAEHAVTSLLQDVAAGTSAMPFAASRPRFLGRGVALEIEAPPLIVLRERLAAHWRDTLTAQDRQGFRPHVTVQNKVEPAAARALFEDLAGAPLSMAGTIEGLDLWHYRGGPWEAAATILFTS